MTLDAPKINKLICSFLWASHNLHHSLRRLDEILRVTTSCSTEIGKMKLLVCHMWQACCMGVVTWKGGMEMGGNSNHDITCSVVLVVCLHTPDAVRNFNMLHRIPHTISTPESGESSLLGAMGGIHFSSLLWCLTEV